MKIMKFWEAVGVPEGILEGTQRIIDKLGSFSRDMKGQSIPEGKMEFTKTFVDENFNLDMGGEIFEKLTLNVTIAYAYLPIKKIVILGGAGVHLPEKIDPSSLKSTRDKINEIDINLTFLTNTNNLNQIFENIPKIDDLHDTISHELKHIFDSRKEINPSTMRGVSYSAKGPSFNFYTPPISTVIYNNYYVTSIENSVRPSELAAKFRKKGVTRKNFNEEFLESEIYKTLKGIRDLNWETFMEELLSMSTEFRWLLHGSHLMNPFPPQDLLYATYKNTEGIDLQKLTDEEICDLSLKVSIDIMGVRMVGRIKKILYDHLLKTGSSENEIDEATLDRMIIDYPSLNSMIEKTQKEYEKYKNNPREFFKKMIQNNSRKAGEMIKKIAGIYTLSQDDTEPVQGFTQFAKKTS